MNFGEPIPRREIDRLFDKNPLSAGAIESTGGLWQIALNPTVTGSIRLNVAHRDMPGEYLTAYCLGEDRRVHLVIINLVTIWLKGLPEDFDPHQFERLAPNHTLVDDHGHKRQLRPIATDPELVTKLARLAGFDEVDAGNVVRLVCKTELERQWR